MRVTMLHDKRVTVDGVHTIDAEAGQTYEMGDGVAATLIDRGAAAPADGIAGDETSTLEPELEIQLDDEQAEDKDAGDADEHKPAPAPKRASRARKPK